MRTFLYALLRWSNDLRAVRRGRIGRRLLRRAYGRVTGRYLSKFDDPREPRFELVEGRQRWN